MARYFYAVAARWRVALLLCAVTAVWLTYYDRWAAANWSVPTDFRGDSLEILARIKAAAEGDAVPLRPQVISRLGAPFGANWSAYPSSDLLLIWSFGCVAKVVGVYPAANLALLLGTVSSALAFYGCARWLRARWEWAFAGAMLFAFTFQTFHRGLAHLFIVYSWTVPLALLSAGMVAASRRLRLNAGTGAFCIATSIVIGIGNPYLLFLYLQFVGWAVVAQWLGARRRDNIVTGLVMIGAAVASFLIVESHLWLYTLDTAAASPVVRNYGGTERYALKPLELLLPPALHRWDFLAFFGRRYVRWSEWRNGEAFAPYLGLVGIAGLAWLGWVAFRAVLRRERLPGVALPAAWVLAFASVGGLTNVVAFFTSITVFRATNRYSIFLSAIVLLFLALRMTRLFSARPAWVSGVLALVVTVFGLSDQLPRQIDPVRRQRMGQRVAADRELGARLEQEMADGGMVFQLPIVPFPEVVSPYQLSDYEYFRPYLATDRLRFTYGSLKGRSRGRWQQEMAELPTAAMAKQLEAYGFGAVYLNRRGFADKGDRLLAELAAAGYSRRIEGRLGEQVIVFLNPSPKPVLPLARSLTFGRGWHEGRPGEPRWAFGAATLSYHNPYSRPLEGRLRFVISSAGRRSVTFDVNDGDVSDVVVTEKRREMVLHVVMKPGFNRIDIGSPDEAVRVGEERDSLRTIAIHEMNLQFDPGMAATSAATASL